MRIFITALFIGFSLHAMDHTPRERKSYHRLAEESTAQEACIVARKLSDSQLKKKNGSYSQAVEVVRHKREISRLNHELELFKQERSTHMQELLVLNQKIDALEKERLEHAGRLTNIYRVLLDQQKRIKNIEENSISSATPQ